MIYVMRVSMLYAMRIYRKEREIVIGLQRGVQLNRQSLI